jgi:hypothetical protein
MQAEISFMNIQRMEIRAELVIEVPQRRDKTSGHITKCLWYPAHHGPIRYAALEPVCMSRRPKKNKGKDQSSRGPGVRLHVSTFRWGWLGWEGVSKASHATSTPR